MATLPDGLIPDVLPSFEPTDIDLKVTFDGQAVQMGNQLSTKVTKNAPKVTWNSKGSELYTLILTDPDAPSRRSPTQREWRHWLVMNIPGNDLQKGTLVTPYEGPTPPQGTGPHRYVFVLCSQSSSITNLPKYTGRNKFNTANLLKEHGLRPVAVKYFVAEHGV